jgi:chromosome segregation ATPase
LSLIDVSASLQESLERERVTEGLGIELNILRGEMREQNKDFQGMADRYELLKEQSINQNESLKELIIQLDEANSKAMISDRYTSFMREKILGFESKLAADKEEIARSKKENETLKEQSDEHTEKIKELTTQLNRAGRTEEEGKMKEENKE